MSELLGTPLFILGILPAIAIFFAGIVGRLSRKKQGKSKPVLLGFAGVLFVPIVLVLWVLLWPLGYSLGTAPWYLGNVLVPLLAISMAAFLAYRFAVLLSTWRVK